MSHLLPYHSCAGHLPTQEHFNSGQKLLLVKAVTVNNPPLMTASPLTVDQEFDIVSSFLLKRTKDMVSKYRQLLVREAQVRPRPSVQVRSSHPSLVTCGPQQQSPSAEMVMLERLFLQAERCALVEDRRRVRREPGQYPPPWGVSAGGLGLGQAFKGGSEFRMSCDHYVFLSRVGDVIRGCVPPPW